MGISTIFERVLVESCFLDAHDFARPRLPERIEE